VRKFTLNIGDNLELIEDSTDRLKIDNISLIYLPQKPTIYIPKLIQVVNTSLIPKIKENPDLMYKIHPRQFEELVADIFKAKGFDVELTKETRDGGRDIIALSNTLDINCKYIIECKRYAPTRKISIGIVQRLLGVKISEAANKGILVTTSSYSLDAKRFASNHLWDLSLKDHKDIVSWVNTY
jgi:restriction system protein